MQFLDASWLNYLYGSHEPVFNYQRTLAVHGLSARLIRLGPCLRQ